jgi:hypothetical protein
MMPKIILKLESLAMVIFAGLIYYQMNEFMYLNFSRFYLIILVWLSIDISMAGYLVNKKLGAFTYNLIHNYALSLVFLITGAFFQNFDVISIGLILMIHVGIDRLLGFGLKYSSGFKDTHIQKV